MSILESIRVIKGTQPDDALKSQAQKKTRTLTRGSLYILLDSGIFILYSVRTVKSYFYHHK